jgi:hypothetical protein
MRNTICELVVTLAFSDDESGVTDRTDESGLGTMLRPEVHTLEHKPSEDRVIAQKSRRHHPVDEFGSADCARFNCLRTRSIRQLRIFVIAPTLNRAQPLLD